MWVFRDTVELVAGQVLQELAVLLEQVAGLVQAVKAEQVVTVVGQVHQVCRVQVQVAGLEQVVKAASAAGLVHQAKVVGPVHQGQVDSVA